MASTRTVLSDQRPDDAANLVCCGLVPALLKASVEDRYHESVTMSLLIISNIRWMILM